MSRILVTFHSRSGNTRRIAQALARRLHADLDEIRIVQPLKGPLGYAMCAIEAIACLTPALRPAGKDPAAYDLVVIGTPVWFWSLSSPVRSWLAGHRVGTRRVAFFCTMGASGASRVFATMQSLAGRKPVATLALTERELRDGADRKIDAFVSSLASRREQARAVPAPVVHASA